jgi:hypothetical protein
MQVQIEFTQGGSSSVFGNFGPGDRLRCSAEHARHFVEQACCAKYIQPLAAGQPEAKARPRARKPHKDATP